MDVLPVVEHNNVGFVFLSNLVRLRKNLWDHSNKICCLIIHKGDFFVMWSIRNFAEST